MNKSRKFIWQNSIKAEVKYAFGRNRMEVKSSNCETFSRMSRSLYTLGTIRQVENNAIFAFDFDWLFQITALAEKKTEIRAGKS